MKLKKVKEIVIDNLHVKDVTFNKVKMKHNSFTLTFSPDKKVKVIMEKENDHEYNVGSGSIIDMLSFDSNESIVYKVICYDVLPDNLITISQVSTEDNPFMIVNHIVDFIKEKVLV